MLVGVHKVLVQVFLGLLRHLAKEVVMGLDVSVDRVSGVALALSSRSFFPMSAVSSKISANLFWCKSLLRTIDSLSDA